jgi:hypothetical protein
MMIIEYDLERMWKEAAVTQFKVISQNFPGWTEEHHKTFSQDILSLDRDLKQRLREHVAGVLTT